MKHRILVWDIPTRVFHWLLALSFAGAWLTSESERYRDIHVMLGYSLLGLIAFRLIWGLLGSRYARFSEFVRSPAEGMRYLKSMLSGKPAHFIGHNPAGAIAILLLLGLGIGTGVSGWMIFNEIGGEGMEEVHETLSNLMLIVVLAHIVGVIAGSIVHRENLARAMVSGYKNGEPAQGIRKKHGLVALALLLGLSGFWGLWFNGKLDLPGAGPTLEQGQSSQVPGDLAGERRDRDDD